MEKNEFSYFNVIKRYMKSNLVCLLFLLLYSFLNILYPYYIQNLIDLGIGNRDREAILLYAVLMLLTITLSMITGYIMKMKFVTLGQSISLDIRDKIMEHFNHYSLTFFEGHKTGDMVSVLENDVRGLQTMYTYLISDFLSNIFIFIGIAAIMLRMDWIITLIIIGAVVLFSLYQKKLGNDLKKESKRLSLARGDMQALEQEFLSGYYEIKNLAGIPFFHTRLHKEQERLFGIERNTAKIKALSGQLGFLFQNVCLVLAFIYGGLRVMSGALTVGMLFSMIMYVQKLFSPIRSLFNLYMEIKKTQASMHRVCALVNESDCCLQFGEEAFPASYSGLTMDTLGLRYGEKEIFSGLELAIARGEKIAVLGTNGRGKTSLAKILLRSVNQYEGEVRLDSLNTLAISENEYRKRVIGLSQRVVIFSGTIYENVTLFRQEVPEQGVIEALQKVGLYEEIAAMPLGLHTPLGDKGITLSGGQAQKIHLARLFLLEPEIILLDEPTSALDMQSEILIYDNLFTHFREKTILVISHRQEILNYCSRVIDLDASA